MNTVKCDLCDSLAIDISCDIKEVQPQNGFAFFERVGPVYSRCKTHYRRRIEYHNEPIDPLIITLMRDQRIIAKKDPNIILPEFKTLNDLPKEYI